MIRLYADASRNVAGHTWSTTTGSVYYNTSLRPIMIGRFTGASYRNADFADSQDDVSVDPRDDVSAVSQDEDGKD